MLRCLHPAEKVLTCLMHRKVITDQLESNIVRRALFMPRRKVGGRYSLLSLVQDFEGEQILRWDGLFIKPENKEAQIVAGMMKALRCSDADQHVIFRHPGDTLILNNWVMLHGRSAVPLSETSRLLERVYFSEVRIDF